MGVVSQTLITVWGLAGEFSYRRLVNGQTIALYTGIFSGWKKEAHCNVPGAGKDSLPGPGPCEDEGPLDMQSINKNTLSFTNSHKCVGDLPSAGH